MSSKSHVLMSWSPGMASLGGAGIFERWGPVGGLKVTGIVPSEISSHRPFEFSWQGCRESPSLGPPTLCGPPGSPCDVFLYLLNIDPGSFAKAKACAMLIGLWIFFFFFEV